MSIVCSEKTTDFIGEDAYVMFGVTIGPHDSLEITPPAGFYHWNGPERLKVSYQGKDTSRDPTAFQQPYVSPSLGDPPILPVSAEIKGVSKHFRQNDTYYHYRYDFTSIRSIQPDDDHFEIPANMFCMRMIYEDAILPSIPDYFKFRGEQVTVDNLTAQATGPPVMTSTIEEYNRRLGLYIQDIITTPVDPDSIEDKSYLRMVDDFNTGLSYQVNLESGECQVSVIDGQKVDTIRMGNGLVEMKNSAEFFDLSPQSYRYIGLHEKRGIKCKVWTAYFGPDQSFTERIALYVWYFADPDWMKQNGYKETFTMPVALEIIKANKLVEFNLFEWSTVESLSHPDLSACYDVNTTMNIQLTFNARFDQYYTPVKAGFQKGFLSALVKSTSLVSPLRVADIDVQPSATNQIVIRFKLLDSLNITGDVINATRQVPSYVIYQQLVTAVNSGSLSVNVGGKTNAVIYPLVNSTSIIAPTPSRFISPPVSHARPSGFSPGVMAGVGVGASVFGAVTGVGLVALVKKCRGFRKNDDVILDKLSSETEWKNVFMLVIVFQFH
ncbi:hypothetical protein Btru_070304 [Bulinus truncatus]|nr:hypothetical protein Btru_070304 [Bulinus truncatus]